MCPRWPGFGGDTKMGTLFTLPFCFPRLVRQAPVPDHQVGVPVPSIPPLAMPCVVSLSSRGREVLMLRLALTYVPLRCFPHQITADAHVDDTAVRILCTLPLLPLHAL